MKKVLVLLCCVVLSSCVNIISEKELIIMGSEISNDGEHKFKYKLLAFPVNQMFYTNEVYNIGDTLKICK